MNSQNLNKRKIRVQEYMKKDKEEIKKMVTEIRRAKDDIEKRQNISCLQDRSMMRSSLGGSHYNKTFYK